MINEPERPSLGLFGDKGVAGRTPGVPPKLAGLFGSRHAPFREADRKSPAEKPAALIMDDDEDEDPRGDGR